VPEKDKRESGREKSTCRGCKYPCYSCFVDSFADSTPGDKPFLRPAPPWQFSGGGLRSPSSLIALGFLLFECGEVNWDEESLVWLLGDRV
jgi:hypothetical protein